MEQVEAEQVDQAFHHGGGSIAIEFDHPHATFRYIRSYPRGLASVARLANINLAEAVTNEDYMPKLYLKLAIALSASGTAIFLFRLIGMIRAGNVGSSGIFSYGEIGVELMKVAGCIAVLVIAARHLTRSPQRGSPFDEL